MKLLFWLSLSTLLMTNAPVWLTNFDIAKKEATQANKHILLNFSGSDWCIPCRKMKEDLFADTAFVQYAHNNLILVNADFPRNKKNKLEDNLLQRNEQLAAQYNPNGYFPLTVLLDSTGKVLKTWEGKPKGNAQDFIGAIAAFRHEQ